MAGLIEFGGRRYGGEAYFAPTGSKGEDDGHLLTFVVGPSARRPLPTLRCAAKWKPCHSCKSRCTLSSRTHFSCLRSYGGHPPVCSRPGAPPAPALPLPQHDEDSGVTDLVVFNAKTMSDKPVARVRMPRRVPYGERLAGVDQRGVSLFLGACTHVCDPAACALGPWGAGCTHRLSPAVCAGFHCLWINEAQLQKQAKSEAPAKAVSRGCSARGGLMPKTFGAALTAD